MPKTIVPTHHVVCEDPRGHYWEGAIVDAKAAASLRLRGVATLPVDPTLPGKNACSGFFMRHWGSGWPIGTSAPKMAAPLALWCAHDDQGSSCHWAARLVAPVEVIEAVRQGQKIQGQLRLTADPGQRLGMAAGFNPGPDNAVIGTDLGMPDERGGWTVYGQGTLTPPVDGLMSLSLWGHLHGLAIAWAAVSQSR